MNIILRELKSIRKSLFVWSMSMIFLIIIGMVKYSGFKDAGDSAQEMLDNLPEVMKAVLGMGNLDLTSVTGYYIIFFLYFSLLCGIHAIMQGAVVISKEERDKTADFLLVKPIKRSQVITSKIMASVIAMVILNAVTWISSIIIVNFYNDGESINYLIRDMMYGLFILQFIYFSVGLLIGSIVRKTKVATGIATGILLGTFIMSVLIDIYTKFDFLKYLTPFKYFDAKAIYFNGFDKDYLLLSFVVITISITLSYFIYKRKDLHV